MKRYKRAFGFAGLSAVVLLGSLYVLHLGHFSGDRLRDRLSRVGFQFDCWGLSIPRSSEWQDKWLWTDEPVFLAHVESWLRSLKPPPVPENALAQRGGRIVLVFKDGRQEEIFFRGPDRPGLSAERCYGFIRDGHQVNYEWEPFSDFLSEVQPGQPEDR